jgi:phosphomannomutase
MVSVNPSIFKAYDIRGIYGQDFDSAFAEELGNKIALALKGKTYIVGCDSRESSPSLERDVIKGMVHAGAHVHAIDECTTPSFYYAVHAKNADGGIMVTASHNPGEYNGFKVIDRNLRFIGGQELMKIYAETDLDHSGSGTLQQYSVTSEYADAIARMIGKAGPTITVGMKGPKASQKIMTRIGEKSGLLITPINPEGLEVIFDNDADRITFFDRRKEIDPDLITLLLTEHNQYKKVVHDFRFARSVRKKLGEMGVTAFPSRVGRIYMQENMRNYEADFGAELSGHFYFKDFKYLEAPEAVLLYVRNIIQKTGKNLEELVKPYDTYFRAGELTYPMNRSAIEKLEQHFAQLPGAKVSKDDGITIEFEDWWFNLRQSHTEPVMRLIIEAQNEELLAKRLQELEGVMRG